MACKGVAGFGFRPSGMRKNQSDPVYQVVKNDGVLLICVIIIIIEIIEMNIIKVALSHFCCRTTVQSDSVSVARQVTVRRW